MSTGPSIRMVGLALLSTVATASAALPASAAPLASTSEAAAERSLYIVQGATTGAARGSLRDVGAQADRELRIIHAVSAYLSFAQAARLRQAKGIRLFEDRPVHMRQLSSLLGSVTSGVTSTVATSPACTLVSTAVSPLLLTATSNPVVSTLTTPLVTASTSNATVQDGSGVDSSSLLFETNYPHRVGADALQQQGITGAGVTIAVLDSGLWQDPAQNYCSRILATQDVLDGTSGPVTGDPYGHGTHVTSIAAGGAFNAAGQYLSIAPQANLVIVQAFDGTGAGRYVDVIAGLDWIVEHRQQYNIRVLNLSFGATPESFYWDDPLNQAVMAAWQAGIVVVAAAGNSGPAPMTIDVPGNVPYVITVGALTDNYTPNVFTDDRLASFSSTGPTYEGFVKPELIAPGGHIVASMSSSSYLANIDPDSMLPGETLFTMSGTSQAAAVTSGVVALMLQASPSLTPDTVKCRLLMSADPAVTSAGTLAYSVFQQGAGLINAVAAVESAATGCANAGLDINADLAGTEHFGGPANENAQGEFYIMNMQASSWGTPLAGDGLTWDAGYPWYQGYAWSEGYAWSDGYAWTTGYLWTKGYLWTRSSAWSAGYLWTKEVPWWTTSQPGSAQSTAPADIVPWVPNQ